LELDGKNNCINLKVNRKRRNRSEEKRINYCRNGLIAINLYSTGVVGESREIEGKTYVVPYSRESDGFPKLDKDGRQYRTKFLNERDKSNEIIVYSDLDDAPAKHCRKKRGHSILREDSITGKMVRLCRLDTPGARVEGSKMEVDEMWQILKINMFGKN